MDINHLVAIGGKEWKSADGSKHRIYFDVSKLIGFEFSRFNTGNISSATLAGQEISNSLARDYAGFCIDSKAWIDVTTGEIGVKIGYGRRVNVSADDLKSAVQNNISM